jgi:hypothetical protein
MRIKEEMVKETAKRMNASYKLVYDVLAQTGLLDEEFDSRDSMASAVDDCTVASSGVSGFVYYNDTCEFFATHRKDIIDLLSSQAEEIGDSKIDFVAGFGCLKHHDFSDDEIGQVVYGGSTEYQEGPLQNAIAWFALEETMRTLLDVVSGWPISDFVDEDEEKRPTKYKIWIHLEGLDENGDNVYEDEPMEFGYFDTLEEAEEYRDAMMCADAIAKCGPGAKEIDHE